MERQLAVLASYGPGRSTTARSGMRYKQHQVSLAYMRSDKGQLRKSCLLNDYWGTLRDLQLAPVQVSLRRGSLWAWILLLLKQPSVV